MQSQSDNTWGSLPELMSPYIKKLILETGGVDGPIGKQFILKPHNLVTHIEDKDEVIEGHNEIAPGMYYKYVGKPHKYEGRVLWLITRYCATYCRFCTRGRLVGLPGTFKKNIQDTLAHKPYLSDEDIQKGVQELIKREEIREVILSGGDPFVAPKGYLESIINSLTELQKHGTLDIIRFHTRMPITNPYLWKDFHVNTLKSIYLPRIVLHINHPLELTQEVETTIKSMHEAGALLYSQGVLLRGINDDEQTLIELFNKELKLGITPYYIHMNDNVSWAKEFTVPLNKAKKLYKNIRLKLSGLAATAKFVIDKSTGSAKMEII